MIRSRIEIKSVVVTLIVINVVIFLFTQFLKLPQPLLPRLTPQGQSLLSSAAAEHGLFTTLFSLFPAMIARYGWVWQFFTYMFLHGSMLHLFFNMYALLLFGRPLEEKWGWKRFLAFYMVTGIGAGIVTFFWNLARNPFVPTIGASGAIFAVMLAFGLEFPETVLLFFFVLPIRARFAALIYGAIELGMLLTGAAQGIGHFTHLAGLFFGYLYYLIGIRPVYGRVGRRRTPNPQIRVTRAMSPRAPSPQEPRSVRSAARLSAKRAAGSPFARKSFSTGSENSRFMRSAEPERGRKPGKARMAKYIALALTLKEKIKKAEPISRAETAFLLKLKEAFDGSGGGLCDSEEFELTAEGCRSCEDFYACLYRFMIAQF